MRPKKNVNDSTTDNLEVLRRRVQELEQANVKYEKENNVLRSTFTILNAVIEGSPDLIGVKDTQGAYLLINSAGARMLGKDPREIFGKDDTFLFSPEDARKIMQADRRVVASGKPLVYEETLSLKGTPTILSITRVPYRDENGDTIGIITIAQDITQRKQTEALQKAKEAADLANRTKSEFLAKMSHEMRTPLSVVIGFCDLLVETPLNDLQKEYMGTCRQSAQLLSGLISQILDLSKIEAKEIQLGEIEFDLEELVRGILKMASQGKKDKDVGLHLEFDKDTPKRFIGDPIRIQQVFLNLIANAVKFTQKGEVRVHVGLARSASVPSGESGRLLEISVRDTGIGIANEQQEAIFEAFNQGDSLTAKEYGGTGLGLTITKVLVGIMGGGIRVNSEPGKGSEFIFTLRLKESGSQTAASEETSSSESAIASASTEEASFEGLRVLVAEDDPTIRKLFRLMLQKLGCEADLVSNGQEAVDKVKEGSYGLVFMDLQMPVLDGVDATRIIRQDLTKELPIIALTGAAMKEDRERSLGAEMNDFLTKPVDLAQLKEKIVRWAGSPGPLTKNPLSS